jgi:hypothetical protein
MYGLKNLTTNACFVGWEPSYSYPIALWDFNSMALMGFDEAHNVLGKLEESDPDFLKSNNVIVVEICPAD